MQSFLNTMIVLLASTFFIPVLHAQELEAGVLDVLDLLENGEVIHARSKIQTLKEEFPTSKLVQGLYADVYQIKSGDFETPIEAIKSNKALYKGLSDEIQVRWKHTQSTAKTGKIPADLLFLPKANKHAIYVDLKNARLYLYSTSGEVPRLVTDWYSSIAEYGAGKYKEGDKRTPIGVYFTQSFIPDAKLPDLYGHGALTLSYPNRWDRRKGRTGSGIWIHGTPSNTYNRPPLTSRGCVVLPNTDFDQLYELLKGEMNVPVILDDNVHWVEEAQWRMKRTSILTAIKNWKQDWESLDAERYLSHYSTQNFRSGAKRYKDWAAYKRQVNGRKNYIGIGIENLSVLGYPGEDGLYRVQFKQKYVSSNLSSTTNKVMFWRQDKSGQWHIEQE